MNQTKCVTDAWMRRTRCRDPPAQPTVVGSTRRRTAVLLSAVLARVLTSRYKEVPCANNGARTSGGSFSFAPCPLYSHPDAAQRQQLRWLEAESAHLRTHRRREEAAPCRPRRHKPCSRARCSAGLAASCASCTRCQSIRTRAPWRRCFTSVPSSASSSLRWSHRSR